MIRISKEQKRYIQYTLVDTDGPSRAVVCPERGGMITALTIQNREILWMNKDSLNDPSAYVQGGIPVLFPICSILSDGAYEIEGKVYRLPIHGFSRDSAWRVVESAQDKNGATITLELLSNALRKSLYPFDFRYQLTYCLRKNTLTTHIAIQNFSTTDMPVHFGFHPYFQLSTKDQSLKWNILATQYFDLKDGQYHPYSGTLNLMEDHAGKLFTDMRRFAFEDPLDGCKIIMEGSEAFSTWLAWSGDGKQYCIEPWTAGINAMNTGENLIWIHPNDTYRAWYTIQAIVSSDK